MFLRPHRFHVPDPYDCEDCGQGWDYDFRPNDEGYEVFGVWICDKCAEKRLERAYLNQPVPGDR